MITYGSLCTGYDGIGLGLALAGVKTDPLWVAETEPAMVRVLEKELPGVPNAGDIKAAPWHLAPSVDLMSSGDPCQSISIAGRQEGRDDVRFLWPWVRDAYRVVQPGAIFFENVANIVSHDKGRTLAERFEHLRADGYAVRWTVLGACAVGAPHHRHRWYAVAGHVGASAPEAVRVGGKAAICGAPRSGGRWLLPTPNARDGGQRGTPSPEHAARRAADPMRSLNLEDTIACRLLPTPRATDGPNGGPNQRNGRGEYDALPGVVTHLLPTPMADRSGNNRGGSAGRKGQPVRLSLDSVSSLLPDTGTWGKYAQAVALWESITGVSAPVPTEPGKNGSPRLNPALPEWMMGLRPGLLTDHLSRPEALKGAGNGVAPLAAAAAWRLLASDVTGQAY